MSHSSLSCLSLCLLTGFGSTICLGQGPSLLLTNETKITTYNFGDKEVPTWSRGALIALERNPSAAPLFHVFDSQGNETASFSLKLSGAVQVLVEGAAHGSDGILAACGVAKDSARHAWGFWALVPPGGIASKVVRTEPYEPSAISIAPDGTVWTKGVEVEGEDRAPTATNNGILRHYNRDGAMSGTFFPQSGLPFRALGLGHTDRISSSLAGVAWHPGRGGEFYLEVTSDGKARQYPAISAGARNRAVAGLVLTDNGQALVQVRDPRKDPEFFILNRDQASWGAVPLPQKTDPSSLVGGDADSLVLLGSSKAGWLMQFVKILSL